MRQMYYANRALKARDQDQALRAVLVTFRTSLKDPGIRRELRSLAKKALKDAEAQINRAATGGAEKAARSSWRAAQALDGMLREADEALRIVEFNPRAAGQQPSAGAG